MQASSFRLMKFMFSAGDSRLFPWHLLVFEGGTIVPV